MVNQGRPVLDAGLPKGCLGCLGVSALVLFCLALGLAVDAGLAALLHFAIPALGFWQAFALVFVVSAVFSGMCSRGK